jgi:hypothetical protein
VTADSATEKATVVFKVFTITVECWANHDGNRHKKPEDDCRILLSSSMDICSVTDLYRSRYADVLLVQKEGVGDDGG